MILEKYKLAKNNYLKDEHFSISYIYFFQAKIGTTVKFNEVENFEVLIVAVESK